MSASQVPNSLGSRSKDRAPLRPDDGRLARGRKSRAKIREAARSLFRERGFDGATLRAIAARAGMGASSIYRHVQSKEELLIDELSEMQEEAWKDFRARDDRKRPTLVRLRDFLDIQDQLLVADRDLTTIALRATTKTEARVARRVLQLYDRFNWEASTTFQEQLADDSHRSKQYKSSHSYSLEGFGLEKEEVWSRFPELNARFGFTEDPPDRTPMRETQT